MSNSVVHEYLEWLQNLISERTHREYSTLIRKLYSKEFCWNDAKFPGDRNRALDGIGLRDRFISEKHYDESPYDLLDGPCTILEMMVALAVRCEHQLMEDWDEGPKPGRWFWKMISSLGLEEFIDRYYDEDRANDILDDFLARKYLRNGDGGLFHMETPKKDMRKVEIWYQMNAYLCELLGY